MPSTFTWLDYSDRDRKRAMEVVDLLREEDTRDELGLGVIRDAVSDRLFPGTSTIQTRVRYFLLIPWVFRQLDGHALDPARFSGRLRHSQDRLRKALVEGGEKLGVIGFRRELDVKRLPSSVYWHGLRRWHILRFQGSEYEYARASKRLAGRPILRDNDDVVVGDAASSLFDEGLPPAPDGWLTSTTFALSPGEAAYLQGRLEHAASGSLLVHLLHTRVDPGTSDFVWNCVDGATLPDTLRDELSHARNFSEALHGAALLYNLMLAEDKPLPDAVSLYREAMGEWWQTWTGRRAEFRAWDRRGFWLDLARWGARVGGPTQSFVEAWIGAVGTASRVDAVIGNQALRQLIRVREHQLKGARARLGNPSVLRTWKGASGTAQLDYRWFKPVRGMIQDLLGLGKGTRVARAN